MYNQNLSRLLSKISSEKFLIFTDQSLFALFNFGSIFILSKLASLSVFSSFVLFQSNIFFLYIFCTFFLSSPILVLFPKKWKDKREYLKVLFWINILINLLFSGIILFLLNQQGLAIAYLPVFLVPLLMSMFELFKKYMFSSNKINLSHAVISSLFLNLIFFLSVIYYRNELSLSVILQLYLLSYLFSNIYLFLVFVYKKVIGYSFLIPIFNKNDEAWNILRHHYIYSKWIILGGIAFWGYTQGLFIYSKILGSSDLGISKIRTVQNLLGVVNIFIISVENFYTPYFSKFIAETNGNELPKLVKSLYIKHYKKVLGIMILVFVFAIAFYQLLYLEKYGDGLLVITLFTLSQVILFMLRPLIIALKAIEITHPFFWSHFVAVIVMLGGGYILIINYEYYGMALTFLAANIFYSLTIAYFFMKKVM